MNDYKIYNYSEYTPCHLDNEKKFKYMKMIFDKIISESDKYLIFGGATRDYLYWFQHRTHDQVPTDIDVLLNPRLVRSEQEARDEFNQFGFFLYEHFGGFEVKKANYKSSNFIGKSFAIPFYTGPVFSSNLSVMFKIDIVYKVSGYFNVDFNVNSLVFSKTGMTTLESLDKIQKEEDVDAMNYVQLLGLTCRGVSRIYNNIGDKKCFGMFGIDVYRLRKMLYKGYTCYTLVHHLEYNRRSIFLKFKPIESIVYITTVMVDDGFEIEEDKYIQEKYYTSILKIRDVRIIPYNKPYGENIDNFSSDSSEEKVYPDEYLPDLLRTNANFNDTDEEDVIPDLVSDSEKEEDVIPDLVSDSEKEEVIPDLVSCNDREENDMDEKKKIICSLSFLTNNPLSYYENWSTECLKKEFNEYFEKKIKIYDVKNSGQETVEETDSDWEINLYSADKENEVSPQTTANIPLVSPTKNS